MRAWLLGSCLALMVMAQEAAAGTVLVVGDSISAALGLETSQGWVSLLQKRLDEEGFEHRVVNASISGDTSAGGASRLPALLGEHKPELVIIELGGNDGLRGQPRTIATESCRYGGAVAAGRSQGAAAGHAPAAHYGKRYTDAFARVYQDLAASRQVPLVPFFLEGWGRRGDDAGRWHPSGGGCPGQVAG